MIVMLKMLLLSFIGALIAVLTVIIYRDWDEILDRLKIFTCTFLIEFVWMMAFLYVTCKPQTILTVIMWMWPALIVIFIILLVSKNTEDPDYYVILALIVISLMVLLISKVSGPVQNLIYKQDMEKVDITYAISSDEILAKVELNIDNSDWREKYAVDSPEMRHVNGEDIEVYHIKDANAYGRGENTEYIPGYAIQKENELPQIVSKRIYFDTSFVNERDALRTIRRKYPTVIIGEHKFDIDDNWNPYEVYEYRENYFSTDGKDYGLIILNLINGTCEKYSAGENEIPSWVDFETTYPR